MASATPSTSVPSTRPAAGEEMPSPGTGALAPTQRLTGLPLQKGKNLFQHGRRPLLPLHLRQCHLRLGQPERHLHSVVQCDSGG